jgi:hypothetical protein
MMVFRFDVNGSLYSVIINLYEACFEINRWHDGDVFEGEGVIDPLNFTEYDGDSPFDWDDGECEYHHRRAVALSEDILRDFLHESMTIDDERLTIEYLPDFDCHYDQNAGYFVDEYDIVDAPYCYDDDVNYW